MTPAILSYFYSGLPLPPILGGSGAARPLRIWDVLGPHLRTPLEHKTKTWTFLPFLVKRPLEERVHSIHDTSCSFSYLRLFNGL